MSETDNTSAKDLSSLKLAELRQIAAKKGLRGISGLRKGDLITAIVTGSVPAKAKAVADTAAAVAPTTESAQAEQGDESAQDGKDGADSVGGRARRSRRATRSGGARSAENSRDEQGEEAAPDNAPQSKEESHAGGDDDHRYESRSQARRARRNRARRG
ncbi:MAG: Rho termination factor N-terminal domain-containing protein, partial [Corynebacterium sp.]|nr:Rho termination factor N-terminal domain-containing protein [Corynebacterium sp.]